MRGTSYMAHLSECPVFTPADSTNCRLKVKAHGGGTRGACPSRYPNLTAATQQHDQNIQNFRSAVMKEGDQGACMADTQHCTLLFKDWSIPAVPISMETQEHFSGVPALAAVECTGEMGRACSLQT